MNIRFEEDIDLKETLQKEKEFKSYINTLAVEHMSLSQMQILKVLTEGRNVYVSAGRRTGKTQALLTYAQCVNDGDVLIISPTSKMKDEIIRAGRSAGDMSRVHFTCSSDRYFPSVSHVLLDEMDYINPDDHIVEHLSRNIHNIKIKAVTSPRPGPSGLKNFVNSTLHGVPLFNHHIIHWG